MTSGTFVEQLLAPHRSSASPWLTWYSAQGERIELSGRVFDNWVAKSANLLGDTYDLSEGDAVVLTLSSHWKSLALALAALHHGATLLTAADPEAGSAVLWITSDPADPGIPASAEILAVNPASLAMSFGPDLGPVAEDYNSAVRSFGDQFYPSAVSGEATALYQGEQREALSISDLFNTAAEPKGTILVTAEIPLLELLAYAVAQWKASDAIVLIGEGVEATPRLREGERITFDYMP